MRSTSARLALLLALAMFAVNCAPQGNSNNSNNANGPAGATNRNSSAAQTGGTPADAEPMGREAPGFYRAGPSGPVTLSFTAPTDGQTITGNSIAPTFNIANYPIYMDDERKKGQHIHVILDNLPYEADYDPNKPFSPASGVFNNLKPGTHTLRAFPSREWHESIKEPGAFSMIVFQVGQGTAARVDKNAPLLTYSRPKGEYRWEEDPRGVMLDFFVTNANIGPNDYKVKYTLNDKRTQILTRWEPVWWKWEELAPGEHKVVLELLDKDNKPVPFNVNGVNYNRTERRFKVLAKGEQPSTPAPGGNTNGNTNRPATGGV